MTTQSTMCNRAYKALAVESSQQEIFRPRNPISRYLYEEFGVSGATLAVADSVNRRVVLLQEGVKDIGDLPTVSLPIKPGSDAQRSDLTDQEFSNLCNHIFQAQRLDQGFRGYRSTIRFSKTPEFLSGLNKTRPSRANDWIFVDEQELSFSLLAWRVLLALLERLDGNTNLSDVPRALRGGTYKRKKGPIAGTLRFTAEYYRLIGLAPEDEADRWVATLDSAERWNAAPADDPIKLYSAWVSIREDYDLVDPNRDLDELIDEFPESLIERVEEYTDLDILTAASFCKYMASKYNGSVKEALLNLSKYARFPIPAYYYFVILDKQPKAHLVLPLVRSTAAPIDYFEDDTRHTHTAVALGLVALNGLDGECSVGSQPDRISELRNFLRIVSDTAIDRIFVGGLTKTNDVVSARRSRRILLAARAEQTPNVFVLGSFDTTVAFLAQQTRAIALVHALSREGVIPKMLKNDLKGYCWSQSAEKSVAIIGAGLAGITAAVALLLHNCKVTIFEKNEKALHLQASASHRYIHPHVMDWPQSGSDEENAELPFLTWRANYADKVVESLRRNLETIEQTVGKGRLDCRGKRTVVSVRKAQKTGPVDMVRVQFQSTDQLPEDFDLVISAVGFGMEQNKLNISSAVSPSYWDDDVLSEIATTQQRILISGSGDGALIDVARSALLDHIDSDKPFQHGRAVEFLRDTDGFLEMAKKMACFDREERTRYLKGSEPRQLWDLYQHKLDVSQDMYDELWRLKREDTITVFNPRHDGYFSIDTALINRIIVFALLKVGIVDVFAAELEEGDVRVAQNGTVDVHCSIDLPKMQEASVNNFLNFNHVFFRHGLAEPKKRLSGIQGLDHTYKKLAGEIRHLDTLRELPREALNDYAECAIKLGLTTAKNRF